MLYNSIPVMSFCRMFYLSELYQYSCSYYLDTEWLTSHLRIAIMDTFTSLQGSDREVSQYQKCMPYLTRFEAFYTKVFLNELVIQLIFSFTFVFHFGAKL